MKIEPYLFLEGRCDEAIAFYRHALDAGVPMLMRCGESPDPQQHGPGDPGKVMHAALRVGETMLMLSDGRAGGAPLAEAFFASSFGLLADRFGVSWMVPTPKPM